MSTNSSKRLGTAPEEGIKNPVKVATTENIVLTGLPVIDGYQVNAGDRVLVKDQTDKTENGIYVARIGDWDRAKDWNRANDVVEGVLVLDANTRAIYQAAFTGDFTVDTTAVSFIALPNSSLTQYPPLYYTATTDQTIFELGQEFVNAVGVYSNGVYQYPTSYQIIDSPTVAGEKAIQFVTPRDAGEEIMIVFANVSLAGDNGSGSINIEMFGGGVGKAASVNSQALIDALAFANGRTVVIGSNLSPSTYDFVRTISDAANPDIHIAGGTTINAIDDGTGEALWEFSGTPYITGTGTINCNDLYCVGIRVRNLTNTELGVPSVFDINIINVKQRSAITSSQANGITIWGGYQGSNTQRVNIKSVKSDGATTFANGAIARGIVMRYEATTDLCPRHNYVKECHIEDLAPAGEADGVFGQETPYFYKDDTSLTVKDSVFINCEKRSVKCQMSRLVATGNYTIRNRPFTLSNLGDSPAFGTDFDAQYGNGYIANNHSIYTSGQYAPTSFVVVSSKITLEKDAVISSVGKRAQSTIITDNTIICDDNIVRDACRFVTLQNRIAADDSFYSQMKDIIVKNNRATMDYESYVFPFLIGTNGDKQVENIIIENNSVRSLTESVVLYGLDTSNSPVGARTVAGNVKIRDFTATDNDEVRTFDKGGFVTNLLEFDAQHNSDTKLIGETLGDIVTGEALNTDVIEFDIIRKANDTIKIKAHYSRRSNADNQVQAISEFYLNDMELSGRRYVDKVYERNTPQAGVWEIVGDIARVNPINGSPPDNLRRTTIRKTAGVTTDAYGDQLGTFIIEVEGADTAIVPKDATTGITPTITNIDNPLTPAFIAIVDMSIDNTILLKGQIESVSYPSSGRIVLNGVPENSYPTVDLNSTSNNGTNEFSFTRPTTDSLQIDTTQGGTSYDNFDYVVITGYV